METISDKMKQFIESDATICGPRGNFTTEDFRNIQKVLSGKEDNFVIFNNSGGKIFDIWFHEDMNKRNKKATIKGFIELINHIKPYVYAYKVNGEEVILKKSFDGY